MKINFTSVMVTDQQRALEFYTDTHAKGPSVGSNSWSESKKK